LRLGERIRVVSKFRSYAMSLKAVRARTRPRRFSRPGSVDCVFRRLTIEPLEVRALLSALIVTTPSDDVSHPGLSLRDAVDTANADAAAGLSDTITFDPSLIGATITLTQGQLELTPGTGTVIVNGGGQITVSGNNASRVFEVDSGAQAVFAGIAVENGNAGGILNFGSLTLDRCIVTGNSALYYGGGILNEHVLTVENSTLCGNQAAGAGGGIANFDLLTVSGSTLSGNSAPNGGGFYNNGYATATVADSTIADNQAPGFIGGGGIYNDYGGSLALTADTVSGNWTAWYGGGVANVYGTMTVVNSLIGDDSANGQWSEFDNDNGQVYAANDIVGVGLADYSGFVGPGGDIRMPSYMAAGLGLGPLGNYGGPTQTISLLPGSSAIGRGGAVTTIAQPAGANDQTIFVADAATIASTPGQYFILVDGEEMEVANVNPAANSLSVTRALNGVTATLQTNDPVYLFLDQRGQPRSVPPDVGAYEAVVPAPAVTSANSATFTAGQAGNFVVTASGVPMPALSESEPLPAGVTFTDNGDGTGILAGTPAAGSGGEYTFTITADNGAGPDATQTFTLTVDEAPSITSADVAMFTVGAAGSFTVTTGHDFPTATTLSESGPLPPGVTFSDNGDGTATFSGTPALQTVGTYDCTITATNGNASAVQSFALSIGPAAVTITWSQPADIVCGTALSSTQLDATAGVPGTFTYTLADGITPASGAVLAVGSGQELNCAFTPADSSDYATASATTTINVVEAPSLVVTTAADSVDPYDGLTSLREAISYADTLAGDNMITFDPSLDGQTITLTQGQLELTAGSGTITIDGGGQIAVSGNHASGVFLIDSGASAVLAGLTIEDGDWGGYTPPWSSYPLGAGIADLGTLTVNNAIISQNDDVNGGGIFNYNGFLTVNNSAFSDNSTLGWNGLGLGGALLQSGGTTTISNSTFTGNFAGSFGGAIAIDSGALTATNCSFSGNTSAMSGGGIGTSPDGAMTVTDSTFCDNSAWRDGGGIDNGGYASTLINDTLSGNSAPCGGAIEADGPLTVINSTISGNSAQSYGGGIFINGSLVMQNAIAAGNSAGSGADLFLSAGAVAANYTLIGNTADSGISGGTGNVLDPSYVGLGPLADNGGPTQTMALLPGSPAIDAGDDSVLGPPLALATDQRGMPRRSGAHVDIGAYEAQSTVQTVQINIQPGGDTYTGSPYLESNIASTLTPADANGAITYSFFADAAGTTPIPDPTDAGTYYVQADFTSSDTTQWTNAASPIAAFTIAKADAAISVTPYDVSYDGSPHTATGTATGVESPAPADLSGLLDLSGTTHTQAGSYTDTWTFAGNGDYEAASGTVDDAIAEARSLVVTTAADSVDPYDGLTSLREAISYANTLAGNNTITFDPSLDGQTITLTQGPLELTAGSGTTTIDGGGRIAVSGNDASLVFQIDSGATDVLSGLTVENGAGGISISSGPQWYGGGGGTLTVVNCTVTENSSYGITNNAGTWYAGGGRLTVTDSAIVSNAGYGIYSGGGNWYGGGGMLTVADSTIAGNASFGICNGGGNWYGGGGTLTITDSTVTANGGDGIDNGGGSWYAAGGAATVTNCTIAGNSGSGVSNGGSSAWGESGGVMTVTNCGISGNLGAGVTNGGGSWGVGGALTVADSTINANGGDGIDNGGGSSWGSGGTLALIDSTVAGNSGFGIVTGSGGWYGGSGGQTVVTNSTVSGNSGGGMVNGGGSWYSSGGATNLDNTIVAGNGLTNSASDLSGNFNLAFSLVQDANGFSFTETVPGSNLFGVDPLLAPLGNYGGLTETIPLLPGSPAIDAGDNALAVDANGNPLTTDQRGLPRVVNGTVDIGAFESSGFTLTTVSGSGQVAEAGAAFAAPLVVSVTANNPVEPVAGGQVTFTAPASGAGAVFAGAQSTSVTIDAGGQAQLTATANATPGTYTVSTTATGAAGEAVFQLGNTEVPSLVVTTADDVVDPFDGLTSLREAISYANTLAADNTITFDPSLDGDTITLTQGPLELTAGSGTTTIDGGGQIAVSGDNAFLVFQIDSGATAALSGLTIEDGSAETGGGICNAGSLTVSNSTLSGNLAAGGLEAGGGILNEAGSLTVGNCTLSGNSATGSWFAGGGIANISGTLTVSNSTFSGNSATGDWGAGGILSECGALTVSSSTLSGNSATGEAGAGGGILNYEGPLMVQNTIIAGNGLDVWGQASSLGNNLIGNSDGSSGWITSGPNADLIGTSASPLDPLLAPLGDYGGPTQTMALLPGSPAIDAGSNALAVDANGSPLTTDQRGLPRVVNGTVDIGAFESSGFTLTNVSGSGQLAEAGTAFAAPLVVSVTANNPVEPVAGGQVTFTAPASGAGAAFAGAQNTNVTIDAGGQAQLTATANATLGTYTVAATASGAAGEAVFQLGNTEVPSLVVTTADDVVDPFDGLTSLREAISYANTLAGDNTITFDPSLDGQTITLTQGELDLTNTAGTITIAGPGDDQLTVDGNDASRVFLIDAGASAAISGLAIADGNVVDGNGGGIENFGTLTLTGSALSGNSASGGGGIENDGTLTLTDCTLSGNSADSSFPGGGGGIENENCGTVTVVGGAVSENSAGTGGGIVNYGTMTLSGSTLADNAAVDDAGGVLNTFTLTLADCTLSGNSAVNDGGGLFNGLPGTANPTHNNCTLTLTSSTLSGNAAGYGGGISELLTWPLDSRGFCEVC
jgi:hypothetical protein